MSRRRQSGNRADGTPGGRIREGLATTGWPSSLLAVISSARGVLVQSPMRTRALFSLPWGKLAYRLVLVGGVLMQLVMAWVCYELVDLALSLMEVWAELARKHLELTL